VKASRSLPWKQRHGEIATLQLIDEFSPKHLQRQGDCASRSDTQDGIISRSPRWRGNEEIA
jgi:hypothetical protein